MYPDCHSMNGACPLFVKVHRGIPVPKKPLTIYAHSNAHCTPCIRNYFQKKIPSYSHHRKWRFDTPISPNFINFSRKKNGKNGRKRYNWKKLENMVKNGKNGKIW